MNDANSDRSCHSRRNTFVVVVGVVGALVAAASLVLCVALLLDWKRFAVRDMPSCEHAISQWGKQSIIYDKDIVNEVIWAQLQDAKIWRIEEPREIDRLSERIRQEPILLQQVFWFYRDGLPRLSNGRSKPKMGCIVAIRDKWFQNDTDEGIKVAYLILLASHFNDVSSASSLTARNLEARWDDARQWLDRHAAYCYFDSDCDCFRVDWRALAESRPVPPELQTWSLPTRKVPAPSHYSTE